MYLRNGLKLGQTTIINGVAYDITWFSQATPQQLGNLDVIYASDPIPPNPDVATYVTNPDGSLTVISYTAGQLATNLAAEQAVIWSNIQNFRDRKKFGGVWIPSVSKWIHTDTYSRTQWMALMMMGANVPAVQWTTMDSSLVTVTPALVATVFTTVATSDVTIFAIALNFKTKMMALTDIKAVRSFYFGQDLQPQDTSAGWPATYLLGNPTGVTP